MCHKHLLRSDRGATLVLVAISLTALLGMAALALDVGQLFIARQRAQNVCDAAALAGGRLLTGSNDCVGPNDKPTIAAMQCKDANNEAVPEWQLQGLEVDFPTSVTYEYDPGKPVTVKLGEAIHTRGYVRVNFQFAKIFGLSYRDVYAEATAVLGPAKRIYSKYLIPIAISDQILDEGIEFNEEYPFGTVREWRDGFLGPGNWLSLRFEGDVGKNDYIDRVAGESSKPASVSIGEWLNTEPGGSTGEDQGSKTYQALVGRFTGGGRLSDPGRILNETDPRFQATHIYTGYNPNAWSNWLAAKDPDTNMYPYSQRIVILPIIDDTEEVLDINGNSTQVQVVGFAAFFITRVYDGKTYDENGVLRSKGDIEGYFIQSVSSENVDDASWVFPGDDGGSGSTNDPTARSVRLVS